MNETIARVIAVHKERYQLFNEIHGEFFARLKSSSYLHDSDEKFPTVGDLVEYQLNPQGDSLILHTLPRKSYFQRYDPWNPHGQAIAANFDTVFILTSANHDFNVKRLRRYLAAARSSGANYAVVITKADLAPEIGLYVDLAQAEVGDCRIIPISAATGWGLNNIRNYLVPGSVSVFLGSSGVGKSTLVNALAGKEIMDVNGIRENDSKGRHTTTHRQMICLDGGAWILDTPGMRELGLLEAEEGVQETFADIPELAERCRFHDCTHTHEPGCAVLQAIREGCLTQARLDEYLALEKEAKRKTRDGRNERAKRQKEISKLQKHFKGGRRPDESNF